ncbi:hypothetical protein JKP88DRAFT_265714 [Tribonema minus]|uniref:JmjC domain-containing protein n=1 Tax=Tribonema minus TaxID=303371 RepID=A0A836C8X0_9STRA|nr:hypothetical protein JKP88DRAFT_265714 [Tribonema minus]
MRRKDTRMSHEVPRFHAADLSYDAFTDEFLAKNRPVIISDVLDSMPCFKEWRRSDGSLDLNLLRERFGHMQVPLILFPPDETPKLQDTRGELVVDARDGAYDEVDFPDLKSAARVELVQGPGEALFVPSFWHHQVMNLGDGAGGPTASINHNWLNAHALPRVWAFLAAELAATRAAIAHERAAMGEPAWRRHAALVMRANCGADPAAAVRLLRRGPGVAARGPVMRANCGTDPAAAVRLLRCGAGVAARGPGGERAHRHAARAVAAVLRDMLSAQDPPVMEHAFANGCARCGRTQVETLLAEMEAVEADAHSGDSGA